MFHIVVRCGNYARFAEIKLSTCVQLNPRLGLILFFYSWHQICCNCYFLHLSRNSAYKDPDSILLLVLPEATCKDCSSKFRSKHGTVLLLCLLRNLMEQTLSTIFTQNDNFIYPGQFWVSFCKFAQLWQVGGTAEWRDVDSLSNSIRLSILHVDIYIYTVCLTK